MRTAPVLTSIALTWALGITAPLLSVMVPVRALLVPLGASKEVGLTIVNSKKITRIAMSRFSAIACPPNFWRWFPRSLERAIPARARREEGKDDDWKATDLGTPKFRF